MSIYKNSIAKLVSIKSSFGSYIARKEAAAHTSIDENATQRPLIKSQLLGLVFLFGFAVLALRVSYIAIFRNVDIARSTAQAETERQKPRAAIIDRNGVLLATSLTSYSLFADPARIWDPRETAQAIISVFPEMNEAELIAKLSSTKRFVWIKRRLTPREKQAVWALGQPGLEFETEALRTYPLGSSAGHILGAINDNGEGISGLERGLHGLLNNNAGEPIRLSIDSRVQFVLENELSEAAVKYSAANGVAAIMDVRTGEIIGAASWPFMNPNDYNANSPYSRVNRVVNSVYEMGSTFKAFTFAAAINDGKITPDSQFDASRALKLGDFTINDFHGQNRIMSAREVLEHSSNIGTALVSRTLGTARLPEFYGEIGLLKRVSAEFAGVPAPILPKKWGATSSVTASYGHGIAVTPLAVLAAYSAITNGGIYLRPTMLARTEGAQVTGARVLSEKASLQIVSLLRDVVTSGTGRAADNEFYPVAGKTGTADKATKGGYDVNRRVSSFAGVFPSDSPRFAILFLLDEPKGINGGAATAGIVVAPSVSKIVGRVGPIMGLAPRNREFVELGNGDISQNNESQQKKTIAFPPKAVANKMTPNNALGAR